MMLDNAEAPSSVPNKPGASRLAAISLLVFQGGAVAAAKSFIASDTLQWCPGARNVSEGPVRTRIVRYEASLSCGAVGFFVTRDDWTGEASTRRGWFRMSGKPTSLITQPLPQDRTNFRSPG